MTHRRVADARTMGLKELNAARKYFWLNSVAAGVVL